MLDEVARPEAAASHCCFDHCSGRLGTGVDYLTMQFTASRSKVSPRVSCTERDRLISYFSLGNSRPRARSSPIPNFSTRGFSSMAAWWEHLPGVRTSFGRLEDILRWQGHQCESTVQLRYRLLKKADRLKQKAQLEWAEVLVEYRLDAKSLG